MKLSTRQIGAGSRTAALVHGASMTGGIWRDFANILVDEYDYTVTLVDLRGHGDSPRADRYLVEDFADDLVENLPKGLDLYVGQSLGGVTGAWASARLQPKRYLGLDPAFNASFWTGLALRTLGRYQAKLPDRVHHLLGSPPEGAAPDTMARFREYWAKWDSSMMPQLVHSGRHTPYVAVPPPVPSTIVLADPSLFIPPKDQQHWRDLGWDIRVKRGAVHDLHIQDPRGLATMLDDVLRPIAVNH